MPGRIVVESKQIGHARAQPRAIGMAFVQTYSYFSDQLSRAMKTLFPTDFLSI